MRLRNQSFLIVLKTHTYAYNKYKYVLFRILISLKVDRTRLYCIKHKIKNKTTEWRPFKNWLQPFFFRWCGKNDFAWLKTCIISLCLLRPTTCLLHGRPIPVQRRHKQGDSTDPYFSRKSEIRYEYISPGHVWNSWERVTSYASVAFLSQLLELLPRRFFTRIRDKPFSGLGRGIF